MKKITSTLFFCFLLNFSFSQWNQQTTGTNNSFTSVYFTSATNGCAVNAAGGIYTTSNGGTNWSLQTTASGSMYSVFFGSANKGTAVGAGGTVMSTTDAGSTWTQNSSSQGYALSSVFFIDADTGYAVGNNGTIIKTTNAGVLWQQKNSNTTNTLSGVFFTDVNTGYAVGSNIILKTTDKGNSWTSQPSAILTSVYFTNQNTGYATGYNGTILKTIDAGLTWTSLTSGTPNALYSIRFADANTGYAVGDLGTILKTNDAGATWAVQNSGTTNALNSVFFTDSNNGYAVGISGVIINTTDGGCSPPSITANGGGTICFGASTTLTVTGGTSYLWDANLGYSTDSSILVSPSISTTYIVTGYSYGCSANDTINVSVNPTPAAPTASGTAVCSGNSATLTATAPGGNYEWYNASTGGTLLSANASYTSPALSVTTTYYVQTIVAGCISPRTAVTITVNPAPATPSTSSNSPVCSGTNLSLTAGTIGGATYYWTGPNGYTSSLQNPTILGVTSAASGIYYVTATVGGCTSSAGTISVIVNPLPTVIANASATTVCAGDPVTLNGSGAISYAWSGGVNNGTSFIPSTSSTYIVTGTDLNGCAASDTVFVVVNPSPTANAGSNQSTCIGTTVDFIGNSAGGTTYSWDFGDSNTSGILFPSHVFSSAGNYVVTFTASANGCSATDSILVTVNPSTGIYGHVSYSSGYVTSGKVIIYLQNGWQFDSVQIATLGANGIFNTPALDPGNYLLKAFADTSYHTLTPTYNGNVWDWNVATVIVHDCSMTDTANITMVEVTALASGPGSIGGLIEQGIGFGRQEGDPIPGLDVKLGKNPGGQIVATTQTDGSGYYFFGDLPLNSVIGGSYIVYADIPGLGMTSSYDVILDPSHSSYDSLNYAVDSTSIYPISSTAVGISNTSIEKENKFKIFPNPFKGNATIEYSVSSEAEVKLEVYNVLGIKINSLVNSKQSAGSHKCNMNAPLSSGIYFIKLTIDGKESTQRVVVME